MTRQHACLLDVAHKVRTGEIKLDSLYFTDEDIGKMEQELKKLEAQLKHKKRPHYR